MNENKRKIHHPDDNFFKKVMEEKSNAKAYLETFYPELASHLNLADLEIQPKSFLTPQFSSFKADIIYRCSFKAASEECMHFALLLWEHKVKPKKWVAIQLGLYIFLALDKMEKAKGVQVEPIIPLLFYNGKEKWIPKTLKELFKEFDYYPLLKDFIPDFKFLFKNITGTPSEKLIKINTAFFRSAMIAMANRHSADLIYSKFSFIFDLKDDYHLEVLMAYTLSMINRSPKEIKETFMNLDLTIDKNRIMSTLEMILKEGEEVGLKRGFKQGEQIGMKKGEQIGMKKGEQIGMKKGEQMGIKKGEQIGIEKGVKRQKILNSLFTLLKVIDKFPDWNVSELSSFTEVSEAQIQLLLPALATKDSKKIKDIITRAFLSKIELSKLEQTKLSGLITVLLKK